MNNIKLTAKIILGSYVLFSAMFFPLWLLGELENIPGYQYENKVMATSTYKVDLGGVENKNEIREKIEVTVKKHKLNEREKELENDWKEFKRKEANLE